MTELIESFSRLSFGTRDSKLNGFVRLNGAVKLIFTELKRNKNTNNVLQFDNTVQPHYFIILHVVLVFMYTVCALLGL